MKVFSMILTVCLFVILGRLIYQATDLYRGYPSLKAFGVPIERVNEWEKPFIILSIIYFIAFAASLYFNSKKRYTTNVTVSSVMIVVYFIIKIIYKY